MSEDSSARPLWVTVTLLILSAALVVVFIQLGNWQMRRLAWKVDLIEAVETRAFGDPVALPDAFDPDAHVYLRATAAGALDATQAVLVKAVTDLGPGHWVMVPMDLGEEILWINTGFVPPEAKDPSLWTLPQSPITGLLRNTEAGGTLLERNQPDVPRWVSRDVQAMSEAASLGATRLYFMDAAHQGDPDAWPRGGLTIVSFRNTHLSYALTWYAMALLFALTLVVLVYKARMRKKLSDEVENAPSS